MAAATPAPCRAYLEALPVPAAPDPAAFAEALALAARLAAAVGWRLVVLPVESAS